MQGFNVELPREEQQQDIVSGSPDLDKITTYAERSNLTLRMSMRRFTGLTNAFWKKLANHHAMVALFMMYYDFCRKHATLKTTVASSSRRDGPRVDRRGHRDTDRRADAAAGTACPLQEARGRFKLIQYLSNGCGPDCSDCREGHRSDPPAGDSAPTPPP